MTSDSKLYALWCPKGPQKEVFGEPFRSDFKVTSESENEVPVRTVAREHRFHCFRASKKRWISSLCLEGVRRSSGVAFFDAFDDFGCPPGIKMEPVLELASAFVEVPNFDDFRALRARFR